MKAFENMSAKEKTLAKITKVEAEYLERGHKAFDNLEAKVDKIEDYLEALKKTASDDLIQTN